ncbi:hypothetical protein [Streptomyces sp. DG1A-41]|uniref:hypothetical protein n=1 Tax=Streptomyces sp. DG1A-41 TaxID=3125779 RepID=UPI0030D35BFB
MHLYDAPLSELTDDRFSAVLAPRHTAPPNSTASPPATTWTCSSPTPRSPPPSATSARPPTRPAAYLEAQARARRAQGHPATALAWGPIGESGYVARHAIGDAMAERGLQPLTVAEALTTADGLLQPGTDVAGVGRYRWSRARRLLSALATARFTDLVPADAGPRPEGRADRCANWPP